MSMLRWFALSLGVASMALCGFLLRSSLFDVLLVLFTIAGLAFFAVTDLERKVIPNRAVYPFVGFCWLGVLAVGVQSRDWTRLGMAASIAVVYTVVFFSIWLLGCLGAGDVKLIAGVLIIVAWLGLVPALVWVILSLLPAIVVGIIRAIQPRFRKPFPQAQFFALGLVASVVGMAAGAW